MFFCQRVFCLAERDSANGIERVFAIQIPSSARPHFENARYFIVASALVVVGVGLIYARSSRDQAIWDKLRDRVLILDRWTGDVKTP